MTGTWERTSMGTAAKPDLAVRVRIDARVAELRAELPAGWEFRIVDESSSHVAFEARPSKIAKWRRHEVGSGDVGDGISTRRFAVTSLIGPGRRPSATDG